MKNRLQMTKSRWTAIRLLVCIGLAMVLFFFCSSTAHAKETKVDTNNYETWLQTVYDREDGLAPGEANAIASTKDGILWVGTYAGLYRYNGSNFQRMDQYDRTKNVNCLYVDDKDRLWVGTNDDGIAVFYQEKMVAHFDSSDGLPSDSVRSIVRDKDGLYYVGTSDQMAVMQFKDNKITMEKRLDEIKYADKSTADDQGNVVAISSYGGMYWLKGGKIVAKDQLSEDQWFTACVFDGAHKLHVGTSKGNVLVYKLEGKKFSKKETIICQKINKVNNLIRVNESTIFLCADNGVGYFDAKNKFHPLKTANFTSSIQNVSLDIQGNLWFTSSRLGLLRLCKTNFNELFTEYSVDPSVVNTVERYKNSLYIGTDDGLVILDEVHHKKVSNDLTKKFNGVRIRQIFQDKDKHLWFCTYGNGLAEYDGSKITYHDPKGTEMGNRARTMIQQENGDLVVSNENGVAFLRDGKIVKMLTEKDGLRNQISLCLLERKDGSLLIGSDGGGISLYKDGKITNVSKEDGLPSDVILRLTNDKMGDGVFVVTSNSLCYLDGQNKVKVLDNFPYTNNFDLFQEGENVFVLGSAGIYVVQRDELLDNQEKMKYTFLDSRSGLHDALVANSWILKENDKKQVYLATSSGATLFDLKSFDQRQQNFRIRIASITLDGKRKTLVGDSSFKFSKKVNRLEINPEVINYSTVDPLISCQLEGFDKEPIVMPQSQLSTIVYTNLPAGQYSFRMSLMNVESGTEISEKVYSFNRETAFVDTIWFKVLMVGLVLFVATWIGFFVALGTYRRKMNAKEKELHESWVRSMTDTLTGLGNRLAMRQEFTTYLDKQVSVTMADIDDFKLFNDTYGHEMGDQILNEIGKVILECFPEPHRAYRIGGDEFLLMHVELSEEEVEKRLAEISERVAHLCIENCKEDVHLSMGSAIGIAVSEEELRDMQRQADQKLYEEKRRRRQS